MKEITIVGGGLAGLGLALGLRQHGTPVTLHEAGRYPRHRVCGEFISGLEESTLISLGMSDSLSDARRHHDGVWFSQGRPILEFELPDAALALSRHRLDSRLKEKLVSAGGRVEEGSRKERETTEGTVWAAGRFPKRGQWIGLKAHFCGLSIERGLELHLGSNGYVGLTPIEDGRVNLCGLFRHDPTRSGKGPELLMDYLRSGGNGTLAERLSEGEIDTASFLGVAGFELGWQDSPPSHCVIGDAAGMIPPFTGNGMTMALESAEIALPSLLRWSRSEIDWPVALIRIRNDLRRKFSRRLAVGTTLHPFLLQPGAVSLAAGLAKRGLLPFHTLLSLVR